MFLIVLMSDICIKCQTPKERTVCCNNVLCCKECNRIRALDYYNSHEENRQQKICYIFTKIKRKSLGSKKNDENVIKKNLIKNNASDIIERKLKNY